MQQESNEAPSASEPYQASPLVHAKGRGALSNRNSRFDQHQVDYEPDEAPPIAKRSEFFPDATVRLITRNRSPDIPFDRSINAYKGCEHGCVYCYARPTHAYLDLSPGTDFETKIFYKTNVRERLAQELASSGYGRVPIKPIALGTNTDPYQPVEKRLELTRDILQLLLDHRHPVTIVTKGALIERDLDLLAALARFDLVCVMLSITTLDNGLKTVMEPRAASPNKRLQLVEQLAAAKVPVGVMVAPLIPWVNDMELEAILERSAAAGARRAGYVLLRLPGEVKALFGEWLEVHRPERAKHVLNLMRDSRGGALYDAQWGERMTGRGPIAKLLKQRFVRAARKQNLALQAPPLRCDLFKVPTPQASLF